MFTNHLYLWQTLYLCSGNWFPQVAAVALAVSTPSSNVKSPLGTWARLGNQNCSFKILDGQDLGMELFTCCPCVTCSFHCGAVGGWEQRGRPGILRAGGGRPRPRESRPIPRWRPSKRKARWRPSERRPELRQGEEGGLHQLGRQHKIWRKSMFLFVAAFKH